MAGGAGRARTPTRMGRFAARLRLDQRRSPSRDPAHEPHHRPLRLPRPPEGRGHHAPVRQSRHHRAADHARAQGAPGPDLRAGPAGGDRGGHGGRLLARQRQARRLQRARGAGPRQRHGLAVQRQVHGNADDPHRRPAGAGPRADRAAALRPAGADGRAARQVGGGGDAAGGPAAHRAPRRQGGDDAADGAGIHLAAGRHPQRRGRHRARRLDAGRHPLAPLRRRARQPGQAAASGPSAPSSSSATRSSRAMRWRRRPRSRRRWAPPSTSRAPPTVRISCPSMPATPAASRATRNKCAHVLSKFDLLSCSVPTRCACPCGARSSRCPKRCRSSTSASSTGTWARTSPPRWRCGPTCARRCWR